MSNGTKSDYTDTGKKVKSICGGRADLTYNKIYDVFIDNKGDEFIIDDVGGSRYWSTSDDDYYELVDDNETKRKFKVGDKVKVVDVKQISSWAVDVKVGYVGVVIDVDEFDEEKPYKVKLDKCYNGWWFTDRFTDKCIELVSDDTKPIENESSPIKSDGGSSSYYAHKSQKEC